MRSGLYNTTAGNIPWNYLKAENQEIRAVSGMTVEFRTSLVLRIGSSVVLKLPKELEISDLAKGNCKNTIVHNFPGNPECEIKDRVVILEDVTQTSAQPGAVFKFEILRVGNPPFAFNNLTYDLEINFNGKLRESALNNSITFKPLKINLTSFEYNPIEVSKPNDFTFTFSLQEALKSSNVVELRVFKPMTLTENSKFSLFKGETLVSDKQKTEEHLEYYSVNMLHFGVEDIKAGSEIVLKAEGVLNPRSLVQNKAFDILIKNGDGLYSEATANSLSVTLNTPSEITEFILSRTSELNNQIADYSLTIGLPETVSIEDTLQISLPKEINWPETLNLVPTQNLEDTVEYSFDSEKADLSLKLSKIKNISVFSVGFKLVQIQNPVSFKPSSNIAVSLVDSSFYTISVLKKEIRIQNSITNPINGKITAVSRSMGIESMYEVVFQSTSPIHKGYKLMVQLPPEISFQPSSSKALKCTGELGIFGPIPCAYDLPANKIILAPVLSESVTKTVKFTLNSLKNHVIEADSTQSFILTLVDPENYAIDSVDSGLTIAFDCKFPCSTCSIDKLTCLSCDTTNPFNFLLDGKCLEKCPIGYFHSDNKCLRCASQCEKCSPSNKDICISCAESTPLFVEDIKSCVKECPSGYYKDKFNEVCKKCGFTCKECISETECTSCFDEDTTPFNLFYPLEHSCVAECPLGKTVKKDNICLQCSPSCNNCEGDPEYCKECAKDYLRLGQKCYKSCPQGFFAQGEECVPCNDKCFICGDSFDVCRSCKDGLILEGGECKSAAHSCQSGYFLDKEEKACKPCDSQCLTCSSASTCTMCPQSKLLKAGKCVDNCGEGFFLEGSICRPCPLNCSHCNEEGICLVCKNDFIAVDGQCLESCPEFYFSNEKGQCKTCQKNCKNCELSGKGEVLCKQCSDGFYLHNSLCFDTCPFGFQPDFAKGICLLNDDKMKIDLFFDVEMPPSLGIFTLIFLLTFSAAVAAKMNNNRVYFFGSVIGINAILLKANLIFLLYHAYHFGVKNYFQPLGIIFVVVATLNLIFTSVIAFYSVKDHKFRIWIHSNSMSYFFIGLLTSIVDYKTIRLLYCRIQKYWLNPQMNDFGRVHIPYRVATMLELCSIDVALISFSLMGVVHLPYYSDIWYCCLESLLLFGLFALIKVVDLFENNDLNGDYYNQQIKAKDLAKFDVKQFDPNRENDYTHVTDKTGIKSMFTDDKAKKAGSFEKKSSYINDGDDNEKKALSAKKDNEKTNGDKTDRDILDK